MNGLRRNRRFINGQKAGIKMMMKKIVLVLVLIAAVSFTQKEKPKATIWLIGDSTMSIKDSRAYPETGWGMPFVYFFDSTIKVDNRAKNGRSTRTFIEEGLWKDF